MLGLRRRGSLVKFLEIGKSYLFCSQLEEGHTFFGKEKITLCPRCRFYSLTN